MIKRTLYFGNSCYLKKKHEQLVVEFPDNDKDSKTIPVEDIGVVVLDNPRITISQGLLAALSENNTAIINCDSKHLPFSLMLPTSVHHAYTEKLRYQLETSVPLRKNLWQQTVVMKIKNQAALLDKLEFNSERLHYLSGIVKSDDSDNCEGRAASYYWKVLFYENESFKRHRFGEPPNNLLNYGYAVLRAVVARSLTALHKQTISQGIVYIFSVQGIQVLNMPPVGTRHNQCIQRMMPVIYSFITKPFLFIVRYIATKCVYCFVPVPIFLGTIYSV